jgi:hypothetical protein
MALYSKERAVSGSKGRDMTLDTIAKLVWPKDAKAIGALSITDFQAWYCSNDMKYMIFLGQDPAFRRFIWRHYTVKVKLLRLYYRIKHLWLSSK